MDVGKWSWFTFGKNGKKPEEQQDEKPKTEAAMPASTADDGVASRFTSADIDQSALDDAMTSDGVTSIISGVKPESEKTYFTTTELDNASIVSGIELDTAQNSSISSTISSKFSSPSPLPPTPREFMATTIHLAEEGNPLNTRRRKVFYLTVSVPSMRPRSVRQTMLSETLFFGCPHRLGS